MVDFDKANNVSGDLENPNCLAYTKPGTYYYRVIEDTKMCIRDRRIGAYSTRGDREQQRRHK